MAIRTNVGRGTLSNRAALALLLLWPVAAVAHIQSGEAGPFATGGARRFTFTTPRSPVA